MGREARSFTLQTLSPRAGVLHLGDSTLATPALAIRAPTGSAGGLTIAELATAGVQALVVDTEQIASRPGVATAIALGGAPKLGHGLPVIAESRSATTASARNAVVTDAELRYRAPLDGALATLTPELAAQRASDLAVDAVIAVGLPEQFAGAKTRTPPERAIGWQARLIGASRLPVFGVVPNGGEHFRHAVAIGLAGLPVIGIASDRGPWPNDGCRVWLDEGGPLPLGDADLYVTDRPLRLAAESMAMISADTAIAVADPARADDDRPIAVGCPCPACRVSLAYLHHLVVCDEALAPILLAAHNVTTLAALLRREPV